MKRIVVLFAAAVAVVVPNAVGMPQAVADGGALPGPMCAVANPVTSQVEKTPGKPAVASLCQDRLDEPTE